MQPEHSLGVVILAGGRSTRMGAEKAQVKVDGCRLIDRTLASLPAHDQAVVVSPFPLDLPLSQVTEDPPYGGPVAGIHAGVQVLDTDLIGILAVDAPDSGSLLPTLREALLREASAHAAVTRAADGYLQPLCAIWHRAALLDALARTGTRDVAAKRLLQPPTRIVQVLGDGNEQDYDTPEALSTLGEVEL